MKQKKDNERIIIAIILAVALMISSFAIASSMRYKTMGDDLILDQWTKTVWYKYGKVIGELEENE